MKVGCVKEIKNNEFRVGMTPDNVKSYVNAGHDVYIEKGAGEGSGFLDAEYEAAGAKMIDTAKEVWDTVEMMIKVKEPLPEEYPLFHEGLILYTYLHLAADKPQTDALLGAKVKGVAYETLIERNGSIPLLAPMSQIAGRLSIQEGAKYLEKRFGGEGVLLAGVPGTPKANIVILGGGSVGTNACKIAVGMGANVMWWRSWVKDAATKTTAQGNPVIFTPNGQFYLDYAEDKNSMASIYNLDTTDNLTSEQQSLILGVQGNIWCEWIPSNARMQYMAIPRLLAIAELGWSKPEQKDWSAFQQRLSDQFERLNIMGINYRIPDLEGFNAVNAFIGEGAINVTCLDPTAEIHYTTDGSTPTLQSPIYEGPIKVTETTDFTFCTFRPNGKKGDIVKTRFIKSEYTPSVTAAPSNPGLKATWHEFKGNKCSEIEKAPVNGTYPVEDVMIPKKVKGNIGLIIKGYFNAPQDDIYTFALLSDDGSTLTIDSEQIVDNDGPHGPKEIVGQKALAKGYHPMELRYFDQNGGQLKLKVTGSDGKEIPFTHLYAH